MKRFSLLSTMLVAAWVTVMACGPWARPQYYVFSVFHRSQMSDVGLKPMYDFWKQYAGDDISPWTVDELSGIRPDALQTTDNAIVAAARTRGDGEMMAYLQQLTSYFQLADPADTWDYPSRSQMGDRVARLKAIEQAARAYKGSRLKAQYQLLTVRALTRQGDAPGVIDYWDKTMSRQPASVYRDMARGLYAWALISQGREREAINVYADMGDMASIKWLMEKRRNLQGIKSEYAADPNSPALLFLVQDYVNTVADSYNSQLGLMSGLPADELAELRASNAQTLAELRQFVDFGRRVVDEGKTRCPAMWMAAAGYTAFKIGDTAAAMPLLNRAVTLDGTERMRDNARVCRLVASAIVENDLTYGYENRLLGELQWLHEKAAVEPVTEDVYGFSGNHYMEVLTNLIYDQLVPFYQEHGGSNMAAALCGSQNSFESRDADYYINSDYAALLDRMSSDEMVSYRACVMRGGDSPLERWAVSQTDRLDDIFFADRIGTKLMREGNFRQALEWLAQVPVSYVSDQGISRYMARRDYNVDRWFKRQVVDRSWEDYYEPDPTPLHSNQKVEYCHDVLAAEQAVAAAPGDAAALYRLASLYYQASFNGDCWYLTRYAWSVGDEMCYPNEKDFVGDAVALLKRAKASAAGNRDLLQACLYALAFIPYGEPFETSTWDEDYNMITRYNYDSHFYVAISELADFYRDNRGNVAPYISRCDVLKKFL